MFDFVPEITAMLHTLEPLAGPSYHDNLAVTREALELGSLANPFDIEEVEPVLGGFESLGMVEPIKGVCTVELPKWKLP